MKTLAEVEARIPVGPLTTPGDAGSVHRITQPGSYYLTGDVVGVAGKSGILISANQVSLDLNGFAIRGVPGGVHGVTATGFVSDAKVHNGVITGWSKSGVFGGFDNGMFKDLRVSGFGDWGIAVNSSFSVRVVGCSVLNGGGGSSAESGGIQMLEFGLIADCMVRNVSGTGIQSLGALVRGCTVALVSANFGAMQEGDGIVGRLVESCLVEGAAGVAITADTLIRGCTATTFGLTKFNSPNVVESY